ncbi:maleylacetoacetate isomerase-like [Apostichopus japonicus]|uniref:maleylacetoacetate isomerase-like n=1 Tax=Stichopus japonicus TaxID=307972 RepID=UPI003AB4BF5C
MASKPVLYSYFRSTCSWRVRIALALKGVQYEYKAVNLLKGEQLQDKYHGLTPMAQLPSLEIDGVLMSQSLPIIEYIDETRGGPSLLPKEPKQKCTVRQVSEMINSGIQPLQNLKILKFIGAERKSEWGHKFIQEGFEALESVLAQTAGKYSVGDDITMADLCLIPQVYNAERFKVDMTAFPTISRINSTLSKHEAFIAAHPTNQPDCPDDLKQ